MSDAVAVFRLTWEKAGLPARYSPKPLTGWPTEDEPCHHVFDGTDFILNADVDVRSYHCRHCLAWVAFKAAPPEARRAGAQDRLWR